MARLTPLSAHFRHTLGRVSVDTRTTLCLPLPCSRRHPDTLSGRVTTFSFPTRLLLPCLLISSSTNTASLSFPFQLGLPPLSFRVAPFSLSTQLTLPYPRFPFNWGCPILISHSTYLAPTSAGKMPLHFIYRAHESLTSHNLIFNI